MALCEIIIQVGDLDAAVEFYRRACGFTYVRTVEDGDVGVVEMDAGGQRVTLVPAATPGIRLVLGTDDVQSERRRLRRAQVTMHTEAPVDIDGGAWLGFADPWGNELGYWEPRP